MMREASMTSCLFANEYAWAYHLLMAVGVIRAKSNSKNIIREASGIDNIPLTIRQREADVKLSREYSPLLV
uniref:Uncharacterized protein n=1 Tax=Romanomermis culicivorax TaxID=13658 RepID=A0A915J6Q4_ROMCU